MSKVEGVIEKIQKLTETRASASSKVQPDELEVFGKYVATQLRDLPMYNRVKLQDRIQSMIAKERLLLLQPPRPPPSPMLSATSSYGGDSDTEIGFLNEDNVVDEGNYLIRNLK